jgi:hypothetical protein
MSIGHLADHFAIQEFRIQTEIAGARPRMRVGMTTQSVGMRQGAGNIVALVGKRDDAEFGIESEEAFVAAAQTSRTSCPEKIEVICTEPGNVFFLYR